jgi:hypothetical protein
MKISVWLERMNRRERILALGVGGLLFVFVNVAIWSALFGMLGRARTDLAARAATRAEQNAYLTDYNRWVKRDKWLKQRQPVLKSAGEASTLLDQVKQIAAKHNILLEKPAIGSGDSTVDHQSVFATVETKSPWPPLVHFLFEAQQPESFIVFENVNLLVDSADPTTMRGKFKIARWFAPAKKG